jgi:branched-chain amino acid transport system substrate-binding protein
MNRTSLRLLGVFSAAALALTACGGDDTSSQDETADQAGQTAEGTETDGATEGSEGDPATEADGEPIQVGVITSTSGALSSYGGQFVDGFEAGLAYATDGTNAVGGRPIEVVYEDPAADPAQATQIVTDLIGQGVNIITGTVVSGVALQVAPLAEQNDVLYISGPAATDGITGINDNTFRSGRQSFQDIQTAAQIIGDVDGQSVTVFAQDSAFGEANVAAVEAVMGGAGATVDSILVPAETNDFTPFAVQAKDAGADLLFVAWAGETAGAMWESLDQQGVLESTTVATGLDQRASYETFGSAATGIDFLSHYVREAPDNEVNTYLTENTDADLFTPDGFVAAQMVVHAIEEAGGNEDVDAMISALEGWTFDAPKGEQTIRAEDHAMLQPMFQVSLAEGDDGLAPELGETFAPDAVAPPVASGDEG